LTAAPSSFQPERSNEISFDGIIDEVLLSECSAEERNYWIEKMGFKLSPRKQ
jgi:hypothetical protein